MKPNTEQEVSLRTKVIYGAVCFLICATTLAGAVGYTSYQSNVKAEAVRSAKIAAAQVAKVQTIKAVLPLFKATAKGKDTIMVKVNQSSLPATVTAGLDPGVSAFCNGDVSYETGNWTVRLNGTSVALYDQGYNTDPNNGFSVSDGGVISLPSGAGVGTYTFDYQTGESCDAGAGITGRAKKSYILKVTPPCPTGVTLTVTATPQ